MVMPLKIVLEDGTSSSPGMETNCSPPCAGLPWITSRTLCQKPKTESSLQSIEKILSSFLDSFGFLLRPQADAAFEHLVDRVLCLLKEAVLYVSLVLLSEFAIFLNHVTADKVGE